MEGVRSVDGFEEIYEAHFRQVYRFALSLSRNELLAEEITQRAFWKAYRAYGKFEGRANVATWLCRIAKNEYLLLLRKRKREASEEQLRDTAAPGVPGEDEEDRQSARLLQHIVHGLEEPYKEVFLLRVYGEFPFARIAQLFGKSESWARVTFFRAKVRILEQVKKEESK